MENSYLVPWDAYPRVQFFRDRLVDLSGRFATVVEPLAHAFKDRTAAGTILDKYRPLTGHLRINVRELDGSTRSVEELVLDTKALSKKSSYMAKGLTVSVFLVSERQRAITGRPPFNWNELLSIIDNEISQTLHELRGTLIVSEDEAFNYLRKRYSSNGIVKLVNMDESKKLASVISEYIEELTFTGFQEMYTYLLSMIPRTKFSQNTANTSKLHLFAKQPYIHNAIFNLLVDVGSNYVKQMDRNPESSNDLIDKLARLVKCVVLVPFYQLKYSLPSWLCLSIIENTAFEHSFNKMLSEETKHAIYRSAIAVDDSINNARIHNRCMGEHFHKQRKERFRWLSAMLLADLLPLLSSIENQCSIVSETTNQMQKLAFEIEGYFEETQKDFEPLVKPQVIPRQIRKDILRLGFVYGAGTVYYDFVIFLSPSSKYVRDEQESMETDDPSSGSEHGKPAKPRKIDDPSSSTEQKKQANQMETDDPPSSSGKGKADCSSLFRAARYELDRIMKRHNMHFIYKFEVVKNQFQRFVGNQYLTGSKICKRGGNGWGTLGGFMQNQTGVFGFTCDHVIRAETVEDVDIYPQPESEVTTALGTTEPTFGIRVGEIQDFELIDISATKVNATETTKCTIEFVDNNGRVKQWYINNSSQLQRKTVFKHGARTNLTEGIVVSSDMWLHETDSDDDYLVMVRPKTNEEPFAQEGDSGSFIFMMNVGSHDAEGPKIGLISVLFGGRMSTYAGPFTDLEGDTNASEEQMDDSTSGGDEGAIGGVEFLGAQAGDDNTISVRLNVALRELGRKNPNLVF